MNIFAKLFAWTVGVFKGAKAAHASAASPQAALLTSLLLMGAQAALASAPHMTDAEKAAGADILAGVPVHADPATYTGALTDAVAASGLPDMVKSTLGVGIHFAAATAVAATAPAVQTEMKSSPGTGVVSAGTEIGTAETVSHMGGTSENPTRGA